MSDNFTELENLWKVGDSKLFDRAVMLIDCFKCFLRSIRVDKWQTLEQRKTDEKFTAI